MKEALSVSTAPVATATIEVFDVTPVAKTFRLLRWADYCLIFLMGWSGCAALLMVLLLWAAQAGGEVIAYAFDALLGLSGAYLGLQNFGRINHRYISAHIIVLPLLFIFSALVIVGKIDGQLQNLWFNGLAFRFEIIALGIGLGWCAAVRLRTVKLRPVNIRLFQLLRMLRQRAIARGNDRAKPPAINWRLGLVVGISSIALLAIGLFVQLIGATWAARLLGVLGGLAAVYFGIALQFASLALMVRSRRYFQSTADELLKSDARPPILFLRSFEDEADERKVRRIGWSLGRFFDYSLEARLARHFQQFGPFVAIGSPQDSVPHLGAARAVLPDDRWQDVVTAWMQTANTIVMFAGATRWLSWELSKVAEGRHLQKLLLIFRKGPSVVLYDDSAVRFAAVKDAFSNTEWAPALAGIDKTETLCAIAFHAGGSLTAIRCELTTYDSYHLAGLVAHFMMLERTNGDVM